MMKNDAPARRPKPSDARQTSRKEEMIHDFLLEFEGQENFDLASEMVQTVLNLLHDHASRGDLKVLNKALKELRYAFKIFTDYRHVRKVSVFGSARTKKGTPDYQHAMEFGRKIASMGFMVITGAGPGIMEAAHDGAGRERSFGVNIRLPFEQRANPVIEGDSKLVTFKYFFTRKLMFVKESSAIVCFPGGFGTLDEAFESLTLMQTGKSSVMPVVLIDPPGGDYWQRWDRFVRTELLGRGLISSEDLHLYLATDSLERACEEITGFYRNYHSMRYVGELAAMRLNHSLAAPILKEVNRDFGDILERGAYELRSEAFPEEDGEPEIQHLPRLVFAFNRKNYGRLRQLIDRVNRAE